MPLRAANASEGAPVPASDPALRRLVDDRGAASLAEPAELPQKSVSPHNNRRSPEGWRNRGGGAWRFSRDEVAQGANNCLGTSLAMSVTQSIAGDLCIICGGKRTQRLSSATGERAYCHACFHGWRTERPEFGYSTLAMCALGTSRARLESQIRFFAPFAAPNPAILEIGCATGELAAATQEMMAVERYEAIELSPAREQAETRVDRLHTEPLRDLLAKDRIDRQFDLILMSHVLEHIDDPAAELRAMTAVLKPAGAIFLEVPNGAGNRRLPIDDNKAHLHFFSPSSLLRLLAKEDLETLATATDARLDARYADSLRVVARRFQIPAWNTAYLSDHPALAGADQIVVWGAGSLAVEILANFFDPRRIAFFVDGDATKQGSLCLGRPVQGPQALGRSPRTVLINSIDFAGAIAADISRLYPGVAHRLIPIGELLS
jgi:2-polyprenyl-3-methyl-5-hydroxy-6-metoxy-1,4-benzoquinol methylase